MPLKRFRDKIVYVINPLPEITEKEVYEKAEVLEEGRDRPAFAFEHTFGTGSGNVREFICIVPQEVWELKSQDAAPLVQLFGEQGLVQVNTDDPETVRKAKIDGLNKARKFWEERGRPRIRDYMKKQGLQKHEVEEMRSSLWPYYVAEVKKELVEEELQNLKKNRSTTKQKEAAASE